MSTGSKDRNDLTTGSVWKKLLIFFLPGGSSAQIINVLVGFFVALTAGAAVVIGQIYGAGRKEDLGPAIGNSLAALGLFGLALMTFGLAASPWMLRVLNTPEETMEGAILYLRIYFAGVPFVMLLNMESSILRALGDSFHPFLYMVAGCVMNIVLDVLFVVAFGWGIAGVAVATVASQVLNMALLTWQLTRSRQEFRLTLHDLRLILCQHKGINR